MGDSVSSAPAPKSQTPFSVYTSSNDPDASRFPTTVLAGSNKARLQAKLPALDIFPQPKNIEEAKSICLKALNEERQSYGLLPLYSLPPESKIEAILEIEGPKK